MPPCIEYSKGKTAGVIENRQTCVGMEQHCSKKKQSLVRCGSAGELIIADWPQGKIVSFFTSSE
jgi:hypothetical protein